MQVKEFDSIDDGCFDSLVFNTQNIAKLVQSPLQPGLLKFTCTGINLFSNKGPKSLLQVVYGHSTVLCLFIKTRMTVSSLKCVRNTN